MQGMSIPSSIGPYGNNSDLLEIFNSKTRKPFTEEQKSRICGIAELLDRYNSETFYATKNESYLNTGFVPMDPHRLLDYLSLIITNTDERPSSLELGCGTAGFTLFAAALGFPAYGIDANPSLIRVAKGLRDGAKTKGFIDPEIPCEFAQGNYFPLDFLKTHKKKIKSGCNYKKAWKPSGNPYRELGIGIEDAGLIYTWVYPYEITLMAALLHEKAAESAMIVLPYYNRQPDYNEKYGYDREYKLKLNPLEGTLLFNDLDVMIGKKPNSPEGTTQQRLSAETSQGLLSLLRNLFTKKQTE